MISKTYQLNFQYFTELLNKNGIPFCLVAGTLLGAIREGNFINHDEDIDIGIDLKYKEKVMELIENSDWHYYSIWRREIGIIRHGYPKYESKIDLFFLESDKENTYLYSYKKNTIHSVWDIEWRMSFPKDLFEELIPYKINDIPVYIPLKYEEILNHEYGNNWNYSNPKWNTYDAPAYDKNYKEIAIVIPTFLRDDKLKMLVDSIQNTYNSEWYKIYIGDQGLYTPEKEIYYNKLKEQGHYITYLPFNCGLSYTRNYLVQKVKEPFILLLDDDFIINKETNISNFINILNSDSLLGVVGGDLEGHPDYNYDLIYDKKNKLLYYIKLLNKKEEYSKKTFIQKQIIFNYCNIVLNFAMFKKELFEDILWDNNLKMAEHSDFYLTLKYKTNWKVGYTSSVKALHQKTPNNSDYVNFRRKINNELGLINLNKKWGFKDDTSFIILKDKEEKI